MPPSKEDETKYFFKVVETYRNYRRDNLKRLVKTKESFNKISSEHQKRLTNEGYLDYVEKIEKCIDSNYNIIKQILGKAFIEFTLFEIFIFLSKNSTLISRENCRFFG